MNKVRTTKELYRGDAKSTIDLVKLSYESIYKDSVFEYGAKLAIRTCIGAAKIGMFGALIYIFINRILLDITNLSGSMSHGIFIAAVFLGLLLLAGRCFRGYCSKIIRLGGIVNTFSHGEPWKIRFICLDILGYVLISFALLLYGGQSSLILLFVALTFDSVLLRLDLLRYSLIEEIHLIQEKIDLDSFLREVAEEIDRKGTYHDKDLDFNIRIDNLDILS